MRITPFYTTIEVQGGHAIRFVEPPDWTAQEFAGVYADPGEAIREFKKFERHQRSTLLTKVAFDRRVLHHQQDVQKLERWVNGR